ncbi:MAG TPA: cytochrome b N-terminal domain-containing protein, partial [Stenomitos sp.]
PFVGPDIKFALLGGNMVGQGALIRFYVLHCIVFPLVVLILLAVHFWRVRKDGGIGDPNEPVSADLRL